MSDWEGTETKPEVKEEPPVTLQEPVNSVKNAQSGTTLTSQTPEPDFVKVSVDMTSKEVLRLDREGAKLVFDDGRETFLRLDDETFRELSQENRQRYSLAKGDWEYNLSQYEMPDLSDVKVSGKFTIASQRLSVSGKRPDRAYAWKRPENLPRMQAMGYRVVTDGGVKTADSNPSGTKVVNTTGGVEQILLEVPLEKKALLDKQKLERTRLRSEGFERESEREMSSVMQGAGPYDPTKDRRGIRFSAPVDPEGKPLRN